MIPGFNLLDFITWAGVIGVAAVVFAESGLLIGFFLPGDSLLITTGLLANRDVLVINIHLLVFILVLAAALGDNTGYWFGRRYGRGLFKRPDSPIFHKQNLVRAEDFYKKYGNKAIVLARFVPFARTFAPIIAGVANMKYQTFVIFNLVGALLWAAGLTYLGYYAGAWLESRGIDVDLYLLPFIGLIILISVMPPLLHIIKNKHRRTTIKNALYHRLHNIFHR